MVYDWFTHITHFCMVLGRILENKCFTLCDPHHGILSGILSGIHSDWHISVILSGIYSDWHSICYSMWHPIWYIVWHSIWNIHSILHLFWHSIWHIFWHSTWHSIWHIFSSWHISWRDIQKIFWDTFWHIFWRWRLRSSGVHCDRAFPVEVQCCSLRLDPGGWGSAVLTAILSWWRGLVRSLAKRIGEDD